MQTTKQIGSLGQNRFGNTNQKNQEHTLNPLVELIMNIGRASIATNADSVALLNKYFNKATKNCISICN
jgi:hypothetical protein